MQLCRSIAALRQGRVLAFIASSLAMLGCSDSTSPLLATILARKYIVTPSITTVPAGDTVVISAQLVDATGRSVDGKGITVTWGLSGGEARFSSAQTLTDASGLATNYLIVGTKANASEVVSVVDERQLVGASPPITVLPAAPSAYLVTPSVPNPVAGSTIPVTAQLQDKFGNPTALAGRVVTWSSDISYPGYYQRGTGNNRQIGIRTNPQIGIRANRLSTPNRRAQFTTGVGTFASPTSTTNSDGLATVNFTLSTSSSDADVITARDDQAASGSTTISPLPGPIATFVITPSVTDPPAGASVVLTANPADSYGNRIATLGMTVKWSVSGLGGTLSAPTTITDLNGVTSTILTTATTAGSTYAVTAGDGGSVSGSSPAITTIQQVALASLATSFGVETSCGIATDGNVWCWGVQVGAAGSRPLPGKPIGNQPMISLSTSGDYACGISGGTVLCWGADNLNQLGDNSRTSRNTPAPITSSLSFTAVSTGAGHACALTTGGDIYCWGLSDNGLLGDGGTFTGLGPVKIASTLSFTAVSAGGSHTCAIATSGDAYCWGMNGFGELGNGSTSLAKTPVAVSGGLKFTAIAAGDFHTCGIAAGTVYCWGDDSYGQLGDGSTLGTSKTVPTAAQSALTFQTVAAGGFHTCAIGSDSKAYCWGDNSTGELGDSELTKSSSAIPVPVSGGLAFKSVAVAGSGVPAPGGYNYSSVPTIGHSCGVTTDGVTYCWGSNTQGELGTSPYANSSPAPLKIAGQR